MDQADQFKKWALSFSGCDGGDIGNQDSPSTWVSGIEWGGGHSSESLIGHMSDVEAEPPTGYEGWEHNLAYIFNWQVIKLLSAISGRKVEEYKDYAEEVQPFTEGGSGFFKMNLYPIAFKDTSEQRWERDFSTITGFESKQAYVEWCRKYRLPMIRSWSEAYKPRLIICLGKSYIEDYAKAFACDIDAFEKLRIDDRDLSWQINKFGSLVAVVPFMVNSNGLVKNESIQKFGAKISELM